VTVAAFAPGNHRFIPAVFQYSAGRRRSLGSRSSGWSSGSRNRCIDVTREKLKITALSAGMSALGGAVFAQYQMYIGPDTIAGLGLSLNIVFAVISGRVGVLLGPTVGAVFTQVLAECLGVLIQGSETS
jgi:ABC-type uncharacterized transport system permease subunit